MRAIDEAQRSKAPWARSDRIRALGHALVLLSIAACDFEVSNPGPVEDAILNNKDAHPAVVNGIARAVGDALAGVAHKSGAVTREIFASGNTGQINVQEGVGLFIPDESNGIWAVGQNARWIGDDAVRRLTAANASPDILAEAHLWAGFASRFAGENYCQAVIDGGPPQPHTVYFDQAVQHFTAASQLATATALKTAALAGRASAHLSLGNWAAAVADAQQVPETFEFQARYSIEEPAQYNQIYFYISNAPYRVHSVWRTPYEQYFLDTGDPRTPWSEDPKFPVGEVQRPGVGNVPWKFQLKYRRLNDGINLVSGREMRLIEAEALLNAGDWTQAMQVINLLRTSQISLTTGAPLEPWSAASVEEAWSRLKRERGIELWLEGRRLGDLRRWKEANRPGALDPLEDPTNPATYLDPGQTLCIPISRAERETNKNLM